MAEAGTLTPSYSFLDRSYSGRESGQCHLLATVGHKRMTLAVVHETRGQLLALGDLYAGSGDTSDFLLQSRLHDIFPWCSGPFKSVRVALDTGHSTLVPDLYFSESVKETFMKFNCTVEEGENVAADHITTLSAHNLYPANRDLTDRIAEVFPGAMVFHVTTALIEGLLHFPVITEQRVFLHLRDSLFDIGITVNGSLRYFNTFTRQTNEDVAYFLLFVLEQLGFDPEETDLRLLGRIARGDEVYPLLLRYIRTLSFPDPVDYLRTLTLPAALPSGHYFPLLNLIRCAS